MPTFICQSTRMAVKWKFWASTTISTTKQLWVLSLCVILWLFEIVVQGQNFRHTDSLADCHKKVQKCRNFKTEWIFRFHPVHRLYQGMKHIEKECRSSQMIIISVVLQWQFGFMTWYGRTDSTPGCWGRLVLDWSTTIHTSFFGRNVLIWEYVWNIW